MDLGVESSVKNIMFAIISYIMRRLATVSRKDGEPRELRSINNFRIKYLSPPSADEVIGNSIIRADQPGGLMQPSLEKLGRIKTVR